MVFSDEVTASQSFHSSPCFCV
uniref:Uncharacterized protein n=1 Tax=Anguilla anguilla TaxID=7936 RepID=A0A0E9QWE5_ANGAN